MNSPSSLATTGPHPSRMAFQRERLVLGQDVDVAQSLLMQLDSVMSMMRYWPAKGTAGWRVARKGKSRRPAPPASSNTSVVSHVHFPRKQRRQTYDHLSHNGVTGQCADRGLG